MFDLPDSWVWDFWFADDGERYHMFFLFASRALHDPEARHYRASIGHAVSNDLRDWVRVADAIVRSDPPAFDDLATWTGSVVRGGDGAWHMFYTGARLALTGQNVQSIGHAVSDDLLVWHKTADDPLLRADPRWYETLESGAWPDEAFRDPWVFADDGAGWHMLITARAAEGPVLERGVVGHARSDDLYAWRLEAPLSAPCQPGFGQLEVTQTAVVDGRPVLLFSCLGPQASPARRAGGGGIWAVNTDRLTGPFDIAAAYQLTDDRYYVGRLLRRRDDDRWVMFAFRNKGDDGGFVGGVTDPMPVAWAGDRLAIVDQSPAR